MKQHSTELPNWQTKLSRVELKSRNNPEQVFSNLGHIIDMDMLRNCYASLEGNKAAGVDKVSKSKYGENLEEHLQDLLSRIRNCTFKPQPSRLVEIPKADGGKRPLSICCFEDKIVQEAVRRILHSIFEPHFFESSFGFRPQKNCHKALQMLNKHVMNFDTGAVLDVDIKQCFNSISHERLIEMLSNKISDQKFLHLIIKLIKAETLDDFGTIHISSVGTPQGSILSPLLCNIFLHEVVDKWFAEINANRYSGIKCHMVRYADDMVFTASGVKMAENLRTMLSSRLEMYGLELHPDKTKVIKNGQKQACRALLSRVSFPTFDFLGFTHVWGLSINKKTKQKFARIKLITSGKRLRKSLKSMHDYIKEERHSRNLIKAVRCRVSGYLNYYAINDNGRRIKQFVCEIQRMLFKWLNRRSQRKSLEWDKFKQILEDNYFPKPIILHHLFFNGKNYGKT